VAHERVLEDVRLAPDAPSREEQAGVQELAEVFAQEGLVAAGDRAERLVAKIAADDGGELDGLASAGGQSIEPRGQKVAEARRDVERGRRAILRAFDEDARHLLDEERHAVR